MYGYIRFVRLFHSYDNVFRHSPFNEASHNAKSKFWLRLFWTRVVPVCLKAFGKKVIVTSAHHIIWSFIEKTEKWGPGGGRKREGGKTSNDETYRFILFRLRCRFVTPQDFGRFQKRVSLCTPIDNQFMKSVKLLPPPKNLSPIHKTPVGSEKMWIVDGCVRILNGHLYTAVGIITLTPSGEKKLKMGGWVSKSGNDKNVVGVVLWTLAIDFAGKKIEPKHAVNILTNYFHERPLLPSREIATFTCRLGRRVTRKKFPCWQREGKTLHDWWVKYKKIKLRFPLPWRQNNSHPETWICGWK